MKKILEVKQVENKYPRLQIGPVSFELEEGVIAGLFGKNGAGKSSVVNLIVGRRNKFQGEVFYDGRKEFRETLAYIPDTFPFEDNIKVKQIVRLMRLTYGSDWDQSQYETYATRYEIDESQSVKNMSMGQKQRVMLAVSLSHNAKLLVFDEPTEGIDPATRYEIIEDIHDYIYEHKATALISTHNISELETMIDRILYMEEGSLILDTDSVAFAEDAKEILEARELDTSDINLKSFVKQMQGQDNA